MENLKIYAKTVEEEALRQIDQIAQSPLGENAHIRIMPDCHAGASCVIGTTMLINDKVCPNIVGVDIGCGVDYVETDIDFGARFEELDRVIREYIPYGQEVYKYKKYFNFSDLRCWDNLRKEAKELAYYSLGTLGGGNHFIECYDNGGLAVHSGSRNIGLNVAKYYQSLAEKQLKLKGKKDLKEELLKIEPTLREEYCKQHRTKSLNKELAFLVGQDMEDYLHDIAIIQKFAEKNRREILYTIVEKMGGKIIHHIKSIHNYIDTENKILRKGAISAQFGELLVIPMNMRDGLLICVGKGNPDWNFSAPHGAGRLYSRTKAKEKFSVEEYAKAMEGIYTTCVNFDTLDEAPFAYKDYKEIMECIQPTVYILERRIPIYNFKAN